MITTTINTTVKSLKTKQAYQAIIEAPFLTSATQTSTTVRGVNAAQSVKLGIRCDNAHLTEIDFLPKTQRLQTATTPIAQQVVDQLQAYFENPKFQFDIPLHLTGTEYQQRVWRALQSIPRGQPVQYGALAKQLTSSARAIGGACRRNPVPIVIPCHRVVAKQGLGGFGGETSGININIKQWLLAHESHL